MLLDFLPAKVRSQRPCGGAPHMGAHYKLRCKVTQLFLSVQEKKQEIYSRSVNFLAFCPMFPVPADGNVPQNLE